MAKTFFILPPTLVTCPLQDQILIAFPDLPGSDQWTTSIYSNHASAIAKGTDSNSDLDQLNVPRVRTAVGSMAFSVAAPSWT